MYGFNFDEFKDLINNVELLGVDTDEITEIVLDAGSEPARLAFQKNLPFDTRHAQESVVVSKTKKSKRGSKYRLIDSKTKKKDPKTGEKVPYLYYVEYGHVRAPAHPFLEKANRDAQAAASEPMREAFVQEIEKHLGR